MKSVMYKVELRIRRHPQFGRHADGEWIELYNGDSVPVNLNGWTLADQGSDHATLSGDLWVQPGAYVVLARSGDPAQNGGVPPRRPL